MREGTLGPIAPLVYIEAIERHELNAFLLEWNHKMGPYNRPNYTIEAHHALYFKGQPVAVTATGVTIANAVSNSGLYRHEVIELTRLCAAREGLCRAMLRLWREFVFQDISEKTGRKWAVSYQDEALHSGDTYRFDGWVEIGRGRSGTDQRSGRKGRSTKVWGWPREIADLVASRRADPAP